MPNDVRMKYGMGRPVKVEKPALICPNCGVELMVAVDGYFHPRSPMPCVLDGVTHRQDVWMQFIRPYEHALERVKTLEAAIDKLKQL